MKILFLSLINFNSIEEKGIYTDLIRQFRNNGHELFVVSPLEKKFGKPTQKIIENDVHLLNVKIGNITQNNIIEKGISTLMIEGQFLRAIKKYFKDVKFDLILYSTPPITFERVIRYIKNRDDAKSYLLLKDIFPQNAVDLNMIHKNGIIYKYFRRKEKKLYKISDFTGCMSQANVDFILKNHPDIPTQKIEVCPNSIETSSIEKKISSKNEIRDKYNLPIDKTVFIYGGNLGKPQGIEFIIKCLKQNTNNQAYFVIVGSGTEFYKLQHYFNVEKPTNAKLLEKLPKDEYNDLVYACDVGLIFLDDRFTIPNFPSRLLSYMEATIPVLAATDIHTDIGRVIEQGEFGFWCESNNIEEFNKKINQFENPLLREQLGKNARLYLEKNYTVQHSYEIIMNHFK